ncbi:MAG: hypothetical protein BJ554DRAFT_3965, partial [Olpidium bornovanus]
RLKDRVSQEFSARRAPVGDGRREGASGALQTGGDADGVVLPVIGPPRYAITLSNGLGKTRHSGQWNLWQDQK